MGLAAPELSSGLISAEQLLFNPWPRTFPPEAIQGAGGMPCSSGKNTAEPLAKGRHAGWPGDILSEAEGASEAS